MQAAAERHIEFQVALYADPLYLGDYPASVRQRVPSLPKFTAEEKAALKGSMDYYAMNHYASKCDPSCLSKLIGCGLRNSEGGVGGISAFYDLVKEYFCAK